MDLFSALIQRAACAANSAAEACRSWENGGEPDPVADTASEALGATAEALEAVAGIDPSLSLDGYSETRIGRLVLAGRLLVLAGTDEGGTSVELELAAQTFSLAAEA